MNGTKMEKLPEHNILKFHPNTFEFIRKEYNLDKPGQMDAVIDIIEDWIKKQAHFTKKDFPRKYLERTIILDKGSVERVKNQLDKLFTMRTAAPQYFEKEDPRDKDFQNERNYFVQALLPELTKDHYRIYAGKVIKEGFTSRTFTHSFQFGAIILEHIRSNDYCSGFVAVLDFRDVNITELVSKVNLLELHQFALYITEGYQMRVKGVHLVTSSKAIELVIQILRQAFSKKIGERIRAHMSLESLYEFVPKELLPKDFGGEQKSLTELNNDWVDEFSKEENIEFFKEIRQAKVIGNLRDGGPKSIDDLLGISGSFRSLTVD